MITEVKRKALTDKELQQALEACAQEPIHIPGAIQPQGYMIVVNDSFVIQKASENLGELFNLPLSEVLGQPLSLLLDAHAVNELTKMTSEGALNPLRATSVSLKQQPGKVFDAIIHQSGDVRVLELEPRDENTVDLDSQDFYQELMGFSVELQKISEPERLYNYVVRELRRVTGFARVKLYAFDADWNGTVIAESKQAHMSSYLGLSFPHTDIPKQARKLYSKNYLRLIPNINYRPVPLVPNNDSVPAVDLSFSTLRNVSPVHLQYLSNMGVSASMSISIMQNGQLWGLIACHHDKPYHVSYGVRMLSELMGHSFSALLSSMTQKEKLTEQVEKDTVIQELKVALKPKGSLIELLRSKYNLILNAVESTGIIIHLDGQYFSFGMVPEMSVAKDLIVWLEDNHDKKIFFSDSIGRDCDVALSGQAVASGVLAVPVSTKMTDYIVWFRGERESHINWAGKPEKSIFSTGGNFYLSPRASFERWQERVRGYSKPWTEVDVAVGSEISRILLTKRYEDSLRKTTENLDSVMDNSNAVIYVVDTQQRIVSTNAAAQKLFGFSGSDMLFKHARDVFEKDFYDITVEQHKEVIREQKSINYDHEFKIDGENKYFISVNFPLYNTNSDVDAVCVISTDITDIKETEKSLAQSNKELERMAYIASHDLQEPLRMISSFTELLNNKYQDLWDEDANRYIGFVIDSSRRMRNMVLDLLQYSRISSADKPVSLIDAQQEFEGLLKNLVVMYEDNNVTINQCSSFDSIYMDPSHFLCVLQNLIGNGVKYAKKHVSPVIDIDVESKEHFWVFSVKDNGIGIDPMFHDKIFLIFQRLHRNESFSGTGVGLTLVQRIIKGYGGEIWLESNVDEGSTFYFSIPKVR